jgi:hypothetical protein
MTIKSLILGSAAALVAVSGAQAADAIMMEPEPVEYVRVCDAYGAGFFYIPGTETCLKISGLVWYQIGATNADAFSVPDYNGFVPDQWNKGSNIRVEFDARSESEWGTLRSFVRLQAAQGYGPGRPISGDDAVLLDQAFISLGGLVMGYTESAWAGNNVVGGFTGWATTSWNGGYYAYQQRQLIQYNFGGSQGFFGTLSLENDADSGGDYMPDVVAVAGWQDTWGGVWAKVGYDEQISGIAPLDVHSWAASAGVQLNVASAPGSNFRLIGYYSEKASAYAVGPNVTGAPFGGSRWSVLAAYYHQFNPNIGAGLSGHYFANIDTTGDLIYDAADGYSIEVFAVWTPVTNFEIRSEVQYDKVDTFDGTLTGFLRFTRYF